MTENLLTFDLMLAANREKEKCVFFRLDEKRKTIISTILAYNSPAFNAIIQKNCEVSRFVSNYCASHSIPGLAPQTIALYEVNGFSYLEQEYIPSLSLRRHLERQPIEEWVSIISKVVDTLLAFSDFKCEKFRGARYWKHDITTPLYKGVYKLLDTFSPDHIESDSVQHGDLFSGNILLCPESGRIQWIDWDFAGSGFPPLFDLFTLLDSIPYSLRYKDRESVKYYEELFFKKGALGNIVTTQMLKLGSSYNVHQIRTAHLLYLMEYYSRFLSKYGAAHHYSVRTADRLSHFLENHDSFLEGFSHNA